LRSVHAANIGPAEHVLEARARDREKASGQRVKVETQNRVRPLFWDLHRIGERNRRTSETEMHHEGGFFEDHPVSP
jgi:hypothetical protein